MREFDKETVRKIWQRVQSEQPVSGDRRETGSLSEWIAWELSFGDVYRRLAGKMSGQTAGQMRIPAHLRGSWDLQYTLPWSETSSCGKTRLYII